MAVLTLREDGSIVIPEWMRELLGAKPGDPMAIYPNRDDTCLQVSGPIDPDQAWFWTDEWQAGEREVDEEIEGGGVLGPFAAVDELMECIEGRVAGQTAEAK